MNRMISKKGFLVVFGFFCFVFLFFIFRCGAGYEHKLGLRFAF